MPARPNAGSTVHARHFPGIRTTVPSHIIKQFYLKAEDLLDWELNIMDGEIKVIVPPVKVE